MAPRPAATYGRKAEGSESPRSFRQPWRQTKKATLTAIALGLMATTAPALAQQNDLATAAAGASGTLGAAAARERRSDPVALAARIQARQHFFGVENVNAQTGAVDESKVLMSWFSVASLAVAVKGRVFLLDTYIYRLGDRPGYVPTTVQELVDLKPDAIFIGHGHGDHADNAAYIAQITGARIFGAAEHCSQFQGDATRFFGNRANVRCTSITTAGSAPGNEIRELDAFRPEVCITAFKHVHSGTVPLDPTLPANPIGAVRDPRVDQLFPAQPAPAIDTRTTATAISGPTSIFYQFTVGGTNFTWAWHDTAGPLKEQAPQVLQILAGLPQTDVELGAGVSLGETVNGVRDITTYIDQLRPQVFFMTHTDNFNVGASEYYKKAIEREFDLFRLPLGDRPEIRGLHDPYDYLRPGLMTFDPKDKAWKDRGAKRAPICG